MENSIVAESVDPFSLRIREEMGSSLSILENCFEDAKKLFTVTPEGKVILLNPAIFNIREQIILYLIGKHYAKRAKYSETEDVGNEELKVELGVPLGSLLPNLMDLRKMATVRQKKNGKMVTHYVPISKVAQYLRDIIEVHDEL